MKRTPSSADLVPLEQLDARDAQRLREIVNTYFGFVPGQFEQRLSWLEQLGRVSDGGLLAKILYKLGRSDLRIMCRVSKTVYRVCKRYQLDQRFDMGKAFAFGRGSDGQLGDGRTDRHSLGIPQRIALPDGLAVASISCGAFHTALVTQNGQAYAFGSGYFGKLGDGRTDRHSVGIPQRIALPNGLVVASISCGWYHTALVTQDGQAFAFGYGEHGRLGDGRTDDHSVGIPQRIALPDGLAVASISCGRLHTALVTQDGQAFAFGDGEDGKLGDGRTEYHTVGIPQRIALPNGLVVASISCGWYHTALVTQDGQAFAFGYGEHGRLGDGRTDDHSVGIPQPIALPNGLAVASISCGRIHTALVTQNGQAYAFGYGGNGRLGDGRTDHHTVGIPQAIALPDGLVVKSISCGTNHTALVTQNGQAYAFGNGVSGRLGDGRTDRHTVSIPQRIALPDGLLIASISCGNDHTALVTVAEENNPTLLPIECVACGQPAEYLHFNAQKLLLFCSAQCKQQWYR